MGAVYKVRHRLLDELRVIKVIRSPLEPTPESEERFLREARTACRLRHPNVALLHDFALGEDGRAYIVLEHIEGATMRELLENLGTPPLSLALEIARQSALALQYLHRQRIVHRDISPGNLMLTRDFEGRPLVKLIDLGLAKSLEGGTDGLTRGVFLGKVRYASPEQFDEGPIDERSDLYSLGVVLYELLTGRSPIAGHDPKTWMAAHLFRPPLDFAESDPQGLVPEDLRVLVLRLLAKDPGARFANADGLLQALRDIQVRFPLRGDELEGVFGESPAVDPNPDPEPEPGFAEPEPEPVAMLDEVEEEDLHLTRQTAVDPESVSLVLHRRDLEQEESSVSIPLVLGAGGAARLADDPSWDGAVRTRQEGGGRLVYEPMEEVDEPQMVPSGRPEPVRRSGLLLPVLMGVFSLAIIFMLVALYSVTSEFRPGSRNSDIEEVTETVAPPAEDAEVPPAPPAPTAETPLIEEIAGIPEPETETVTEPVRPPVVERPRPEPEPRQEPVRVARREEPVRTAPPKPAPRTEEPAREVREEEPARPVRRAPVVREGGIRPGPGVVPPIPLDMPRYSYPAAARGQGIELDVRVDLLVDERGKVIEAVVREGDAAGLGFNETAIAAARRISFQPATRGAEPVKMWTEMIFQFSEPGGRGSSR
jgi:TonB family protein